MERLLIIGPGDVARRALPELAVRYAATALVRGDPAGLGVATVGGDLDRPASLAAPFAERRFGIGAPPCAIALRRDRARLVDVRAAAIAVDAARAEVHHPAW